jgi:plasmid stabilization system protein ParE
MRLELAPRARRDLVAISSYLRSQSPGGASNVMRRIRDAVERLAEFPESGEATIVPGIRRAFIGRYPYTIYYTLGPDRVRVLHVRHTSRESVDLKTLDR